MAVNVNAILDSIDTRLDSMVRRPHMWGGPEAIELLAVQLLEFRSMVGRPEQHEACPDEVRRLWWAFTSAKAGRPYNSPLFAIYDGLDIREFGKVVGEFVDYVRSRLPLDG